jgi:hypothetical protein
MPKITWAAKDDEEVLSASDIDDAEDNGFTPYTGDIPPGGVYRFRIRRFKYTEFGSGNQGFNNLFELDGSWKPNHEKYDGCPLWDRVVMTKAAASFAKAFAAALGVTSEDLVSRVVVDEDNVVTKIGKKTIKEGMPLYIAVKRGSYNDEPRLETVGTGYQVVEADDADTAATDAPAPKKAAKATAGKAAPEPTTKAKGKKSKSKADDDEPPF